MGSHDSKDFFVYMYNIYIYIYVCVCIYTYILCYRVFILEYAK